MAEQAEGARAPEPGAATVELVDLQAQRSRLGRRLDRAMARVLEHGRFVKGPEVDRLEDHLARFCGRRHAVTCASGTDALLLALLAHEVGPGDAVLVPAFTFVATAEAVARTGATPVLVDVMPDTFTLDPASLAAALDEPIPPAAGRPVGVIAVDLFGQPAEYEAIADVARSHGLWILADASQSFGGRLNGRPVGTLAEVTTTSFFPTKPLGCYGDGGALFTDDDVLAERFRSLRAHGRSGAGFARVGLNSRLDTIQAATLLEKLVILGDELAARQQVALRYHEGLEGAVKVPIIRANATSAWACYTVRVPHRDALAAYLAGERIATAVYYGQPLHAEPAYRRCPTAPGGLPVSERLSREVLSLPMHPYLAPSVQDRVILALRSFLASLDQ